MKNRSTMRYTTQAQVRAAFWAAYPDAARRPGRQHVQPADTRLMFGEYVEHLAKNGDITEALAKRVMTAEQVAP